MKKLLSILVLIPSLLLADTYIVMWLNTAASAGDKIKVRDGLYTLLNDRTKINTASLPQWRLISNTNVVGWTCVINVENPRQLKANMDNLTLAKLNEWRDNNLANPNHLKWDVTNNWRQVLIDRGLEPVTNGVAQ